MRNVTREEINRAIRNEWRSLCTDATPRPSGVLFWLAVFAFAILCAYRAVGQVSDIPAIARAQLQAQLDAGYLSLAPGTVTIDGPLYVRSRTLLRGCGLASTIRLAPNSGQWAIIVQPLPRIVSRRLVPGYIYGADLESFAVSGGGIRFDQVSQTCSVAGVWVSGAPGDGFLISGDGEQQVFRDCKAWSNGGAGFAVRTAGANNGIVLDHCNAQSNAGPGIVFETTADGGDLSLCEIARCTVQGNGQPQIHVRGYVTSLTIADTWVESDAAGAVGIQAESVPAVPPRRDPWRPAGLRIQGRSVVSLIPRAVRLIDAPSADIDTLAVYPSTAVVEWQTWRPGGRMLRLGAERLREVTPDELGAIAHP